MAQQRTISKEFRVKGIGLHTGRKCQAVFKPAPVDHGVVFARIDLPGTPEVHAHVDHVVDIVRGTTLGIGTERVYTIEHILSALNGLAVDNVRVELDDNEPPVLDGSARGFVDQISAAGIVEQDAPKRFFSITEPFEYRSNKTLLRVEPSDTLEIHCEVDYDHPMIRQQTFDFRREDGYGDRIAPARTFCFDYEIESLKKNGLAKGGSLENAIVIGPAGIYNADTALRFPDEFVRHKVLDLMGDLMLIGQPLLAKVTANRCGHGHNVKFIRQLLARARASNPVPAAS